MGKTKLKENVELLYQEVELKFEAGEELPNKVKLALLAKNDLRLTPKEAILCVNTMQGKYAQKLTDMGYFKKRKLIFHPLYYENKS